jgi:hypothetical protein
MNKILFSLLVVSCTVIWAMHDARGAQDKPEISRACTGNDRTACKQPAEDAVLLCLKGRE